MPRRMKDSDFSEDQFQRRYASHVEPLNRFIDELRKEMDDYSVPYIPPMYGGVKARLLSVLRDPGPMTQESGRGSGFIGMENDDPTAEALCQYFDVARIPAKEIVPWNAYPWYINCLPTTDQLREGTAPLKNIIDLMPKLKVVMLHGGVAHRAWRRLVRTYPELVQERELHIIMTYHTGRQAFWHNDPEVRKRRKQHLQDAFAESRRWLFPERGQGSQK